MNILALAGIGSMIFVAAFTAHQARKAAGVGQSPRSSVIEAWVNIAIGFAINYFANLLILPAVMHASLSAWDNWWMGWVYTTISLARQYAIRRWFNAAAWRRADRTPR